MITPFRENFKKIGSYNIFIQPYKKCVNNFKIAFFSDKESVNKKSLCTRVSFLIMGIIYSIPIINTIIYVALNILFKDNVLSYDQVIDRAMFLYASNKKKDEIIENIKLWLEYIKYEESINTGRRPCIHGPSFEEQGHFLRKEEQEELDEKEEKNRISFIAQFFVTSLPMVHNINNEK